MKAYIHCALVFTVMLLPSSALAEKWVEFHAESWNHYSQRLNKKIQFNNYSYFDKDSVAATKNGDIKVRIMDVSHNDRFYVGKGVAEKEVVYKEIVLRCASGKYAVLIGDEEEGEPVSDDIKSGSAYHRLFLRLCIESR